MNTPVEPTRDSISDEISDMFSEEEVLKPLDTSSVKDFLTQDILELETFNQSAIPQIDQTTPKFLQEAAFRVYKALDLYAGKHIKEWCANQEYVFRMIRRKDVHVLFLTKDAFIPCKYHIQLENKNDVSDVKTIASAYDTPALARIHGAEQIGFNDSVYFLKAWRSVSIQTKRALILEGSYMSLAQEFLKLEEIRAQITQYHPKNPKLRVQYLEDIDRQIRTLGLRMSII
jgi:hypothetical protein